MRIYRWLPVITGKNCAQSVLQIRTKCRQKCAYVNWQILQLVVGLLCFTKRAENVLKTCWKRAENMLKTCWKRAQNVLKMHVLCRQKCTYVNWHVLNTFWANFTTILRENWLVATKGPFFYHFGIWRYKEWMIFKPTGTS